MRPDLWHDLLKTALLGTERQRPSALGTGGGGALAAAFAKLSAAAPDAAVLGAAAVVSTSLRAGRVAPVDESVRRAEPCEPDDFPPAGPRSEQHLRRLLAGDHMELLPEWLSAAAASGKRAPAMTLPALLDLARQKPELREAVVPVLGKRGRWLAAQNPDWSFAVGATGPSADDAQTESLWQTGDRAARMALLSRLRHGDPARARALLEATWSQEPAADRGWFLATFQTGLSPADEPFLEAALDDRGKEVRRIATDFLSRLGNSQLVRRMTERAIPLLEWKAGKKPRVDVTLPPAPDKAAERDGVEAKGSQFRFGQKQGWLWFILSSVPPATWSKRWVAKPAEILEAVRKNEFENVLVSAWAQAAARAGDAAWAEAVVASELMTVMEWGRPDLAAELQSLLPDMRRESIILEFLQSRSDARHADDPVALTLLQAHERPWSPTLARAVVEHVREMIRKPPRANYWQGSAMLREAALRTPPAMLDELAAGWPEKEKDWDRWKGVVDEFLSTVQFRRDMLEEVRR